MDARAEKTGKWMLEAFRKNLSGTGGVVRISGLGMMLGIELDRPCSELVTRSLGRNLLINVTAEKVVRLLPPLIINDDEARQIVSIVTDLIRDFLQA
jgi:acetylornithine aminotransferase